MNGVIANLEDKAAQNLGNLMNPFSGGKVSCPWLRRFHHSLQSSNVSGLFLMQDWGNEQQTLSDAIKEIDGACASQGKTGDTSLRNLLSVKHWREAVENGEWLVSNAVWGLRKSSSKSGYLGDKIHNAAFPVWLDLVRHLSSNREDFKLVVAGGWAVFKDEFKNGNGCIPMDDYLNLWIDWVSSSKNPDLHRDLSNAAKDCRGMVYHVHHPATWRWTSSSYDWRMGPPLRAHEGEPSSLNP